MSRVAAPMIHPRILLLTVFSGIVNIIKWHIRFSKMQSFQWYFTWEWRKHLYKSFFLAAQLHENFYRIPGVKKECFCEHSL